MNDLATIEDRLRRTYQAVADTTVVTPAEMPDVTEIRSTADFTIVDLNELPDPDGRTGLVSRWASRRRLLLTAAAVAAVVGLAMVAVAVRNDGDGIAGYANGPARTVTLDPGWTGLEEPPYAPRQASSNVWTGREMITFGGFNATLDSEETGDGAAAYDPDTDSWREIAEPPEQLRGEALAVWTGDVVVALPISSGVTTSSVEQPGAVYDPEADEWHEIPVSEVGMIHWGSQVFWTGDRVLVAGMFDPADATWKMDRAATFDPAAGTWERLADAPVLLGQVQGEAPPEAVWTGEAMIYVGVAIENPREVAVDDRDEPIERPDMRELPGDRYAALKLDPAAGTWEELPAPPLAPRFNLSVAWTGREVFVGGGITVQEESLLDSVVLDPATGMWESLPEMPAELQPNFNDDDTTGSASLAGGQLVFFQPVHPEERPMLLDTATRTWSFGEAHPDAVSLAATVSIGDSVLVWGGNDLATYESFGGGYAFTP